jgi:ABC-type maltose transport system permease subunit
MWKLLIGAEGVILLGAVGNVGVPFHSVQQFLVYESVYLVLAIVCGALSIYMRMLKGWAEAGLSFKGCIACVQAKVFYVGIAAILAMITLYTI